MSAASTLHTEPGQSALADFHPACRRWFESAFGEPSPAQADAWPAIKAGRHTLISAPTGSGKTLAAFYAAIDELVQRGSSGQLQEGVQILYVSPLKALSNDIQRNLEQPLDGIAEQLHLLGQAPVDIRIAVRTGDTPANERQKMARRPPHILVTTPESLYLLLSSGSGRKMLASVSSLIVDEIHAMLGDKRGAHLALSVERLQRLVHQGSGLHLQRIGLSATQKPIERVARFLVGMSNCAGEKADCVVVDNGHRRNLDLRLEVPGSPLSALMSNEVWEELYERLVDLILGHETTLVFVNTRRLSERLALALSERLGPGSVCSHHGSMSKEHRFEAEQKLKSGQLKVLVATASMELGIDVGSIDLVVQFASPKSIATFLQRVGRSGHTLKGTPKGILFPLTRDDLVECVALLRSIRSGELDQIVMPEQPLDILAQQIIAELSSISLGSVPAISAEADGAVESVALDELYLLFINAYPYRDLSRDQFDQLMKMLAEGYSTRRGRRGTHVHLDAINQRVRARRGANLIALTNGGAIPDMFDYQVVLDPEDTVVGTLNEDFALEALPGDVFTLGTHSWQILRVDGLKVRVRDAEGMSPTVPFWFGEGPGRTLELSESVSTLKQAVENLLLERSADDAVRWLCEEVGVFSSAAVQLVEYLQAGMNALGVMPTRDTLVMERFFDEVGDMHVVIHSPFGSRLNRGWGLALRKRFCKSFNFELQAAANEDSIVISLGSVHSFPLDDVYRYLQATTVREVLIQALLDSPMFEVRWRWNATRCLAIQRNRNGKRVPPQFQRMDAEDLVAHVFPDQIACQENITGKRDVPDHPLVNQTVNDCLTEAMDIEELEQLIARIEKGELQLIAKDLREPSPFAQEIITARPYAFLDDAPFEERRTNAIRHRGWAAEPGEVKDYSLLDADAIARVRDEAWPLVRDSDELHDALFSLGYITASEFASSGFGAYVGVLEQAGRALRIEVGGAEPLWVASETLPRLLAVFPQQLESVPLPAAVASQQWQREDALKEIVRGRLEGLGPIIAERLAIELAIDRGDIDFALAGLEVEGFVFQGQFSPALRVRSASDSSVVEWCERRLLQRIHRYTLDSHRKRIQPVSLETYTQFLFERHQLQPVQEEKRERRAINPPMDGQSQLQKAMAMLDGVVAPATSWEADLLPQRVAHYDPLWLDNLCVSGRLIWGRFSQPSRRSGGRLAGPIKSTPIAILSRENEDLWLRLAQQGSDQEPEAEPLGLSASAIQIEEDLLRCGASFLNQIQSRTELVQDELEKALAELVSAGRLTSDGFTGVRALLTPAARRNCKRSRAFFGLDDAGRWSLLARSPEAATQRAGSRWDVLNEAQLERLVAVYLQRWGVLFRGAIERESFAPPWRVLLTTLRKMELRGILRGGRFISGVGGEQFAYQETVDELRKLKQRAETRTSGRLYLLSAVDPLCLINLLLPKQKLARLAGNRVLYRDGIPQALLDSGELRLLRELDESHQAECRQLLTEGHQGRTLRYKQKNPANAER